MISIGTPNPKQIQFLRATQRYVAYGGARGGGKSWSIRCKSIALAKQWPGIKMMIVRKTYQELINNHVVFLKPMLKGIARYNKTDKEFVFYNGSSLKLSYCATESDLDHFQGLEIDVLFIDEAGLLQEDWIKKMNACVRGANEFPKRTYYTLNPGGPSHAYFRRLFVERQFKPSEDPEEYTFIQALAQDNTALMAMQPDYIKQLEVLPARVRAAWLEGRWDIYEGMVFEEFTDLSSGYDDHVGTHVINPFRIPDHWVIWRSMDWGYAKPFSVHWTAIEPGTGRFYIINELYGCTGEPDEGVRWDPARVAKEIRAIEAADPNIAGRDILGVADPAIWGSQSGESIAFHMERGGVHFVPANHDRLNGLMQVHWRLAFDDEGIARMLIFKTCKHLIRTLPALQYSETHAEDVDTKMEDHAYDEIRYLCMEHPISPPSKVRFERPQDDPLDMFTVKKPRRRL